MSENEKTPDLSLSSSPEWAKVCPENFISPDKDFYWIYESRQYMVTESQTARFYANGFHIRDEEELNRNQKLQIGFDPHYQDVSIHELFIFRDGQKISLEKDLAKATVLRRETNLERQILDGLKQQWKNFRYIDLYFDSGMKIKKLYYAVHWKLNASIQTKHFLSNAKQDYSPRIVQHHAPYQEMIWDFDNIDAVDIPESTPAWFQSYHHTQVSNQSSWEDVIAWGKSKYNFTEIKPSEGLIEVANSLKGDTVEASIANALNFVQEHIRYFSISLNEGGHQPRDPNAVLETRLGDCKDKTSLFLYLINQFGHEDVFACPALINTTSYIDLSTFLPSPFAFDHVIAYLEYGEKSYYFDPTYDAQKFAFEHIPRPSDFNYALHIDDRFSNLSKVDLYKKSKTHIQVIYDLSQGVGMPVLLKVSEKRFAFYASNERHRYKKDGEEKYKDGMLAFYKKYFNDIKQIDFKVIDNLQNNQFDVQEVYEIKDFWKEKENHFTSSVFPLELCGKVSRPTLVERKHFPLNISSDANDVQYQITLLSDRVWNYEDSGENIDHAYWSYKSTKKEFKDEKKVLLKSHLQIHNHALPAEHVKAYYDFVDDVFYDDLALDFTSAKNEEKEVPLFSWLAAIIAATIIAVLLIIYGSKGWL